MKKLLIAIVLVAILAGAWYLISPLFIDKVVDEAFPTISEDMTQEELEKKIMEEHPTDPEVLAAMTEEEKEAMERKIVEEFAKIPPKVMDEELPTPEPAEPTVGAQDPAPKEGEAESEDQEPEPEPVVAEPTELASGSFQDPDKYHKGSGSARIFELADGSQVLRLENFSVTNGPDLRVYLTNQSNPTKGQVKSGLQLGKLKGNIGNQNYSIPSGVDGSTYGAVVIYCEPFSVIFSTASLR